MLPVKQSTARTIVLGPFVDSTDSVTPKTALTIAQADIRLSLNGGAFAQTHNATGGTHMENGHYSIPLDTTDTATTGIVRVAVYKTTALPCWLDCVVMSTNAYDAWVSDSGVGILSNLKSYLGNTCPTADTAGYPKTTSKAGTGTGELNLTAGVIDANVTKAAGTAWASGAITSGVFASGAINRAALAADTGLQSSRSNTAQAGGATTITLDASANATNNFYNNMLLVTTGGTGAGQARFITAYVGATKVATVATWTTNPDATTTFAIMPFDAVAGATAPTTAQIATAVWTDLLASSDFSTASSIGKLLKDDIDAAISSRLAPTVAARTLDVSAGGEAGVDWANIGSPTTSNALTGTTIATTQKVDIETIKTNPVVNAGTITFPTTATLASTTNITAGTIATVTNLTNAPTAGDHSE